MDANGDGQISRAEFAFAQMDANGDGQISREEFERAMAAQQGSRQVVYGAPQVTYVQPGYAQQTQYMTEPVAAPQYAAPTITTAEPVYMQAPAARAMEAPATMMSPIITTAQPVYLTAPAVMESREMVEVGEPTPVATNMRPPVPVSSNLQVVQGGVRQEKVVTESFRDEGRTTVTSYAPTTTVTKELGQAVYVTGPTTEEESAPQITKIGRASCRERV